MFLRKGKLCAISVYIFLSPCTGHTQSPGGFLNKKNEVSVDLLEPFNHIANIWYKYSFHKHCALSLYLGREFGKSDIYKYFEDSDVVEIYGAKENRSIEYGIGIILNSPATGMPLPLGNYFGMSYFRNHVSRYSEHIDSTGLSYKYSSKGYSVRWFWGREMYIAKNFVFDYNFSIGFYIGKISYLDGNTRRPFSVLPFDNILADINNYNFIKGGNTYFNSFYFMPKIKIGYLF